MKKAIRNFFVPAVLFCLIIGIETHVYAQRFVIGMRLMPVISSMQLQSEEGYAIKGRTNAGFGASGFVGYRFHAAFGLQAEIHLSSFALRYEERSVTRKVNLQYVQIPLLLALNTGRNRLVNLNVVAGPQVGINTGAGVRISGANSSTPVAVLAVRKVDVGFAYGAGLDVGINRARTVRMGAGYRGVSGLLNIGKPSAPASPGTFYIADETRVQTHAIYLVAALAF